MIETHVVWLARIIRVKVASGAGATVRGVLLATKGSAAGEFAAGSGERLGVEGLDGAAAADDLPASGAKADEVAPSLGEPAEGDVVGGAGDCAGREEEGD